MNLAYISHIGPADLAGTFKRLMRWAGTELFIWLNKNGYKTTDRNCFEIYYNDPKTHPENKFILDMCIPVD